MKHAPDMINPITDHFAAELMVRTPAGMVPDLDVSRDRWGPWISAPARVRATFRARAIRFLHGDMSMLPPTIPISAQRVAYR